MACLFFICFCELDYTLSQFVKEFSFEERNFVLCSVDGEASDAILMASRSHRCNF